MNTYRIVLAALCFMMMSMLSACDNSEKTSKGAGENMVKSVDACNLLTQEEVDGLFTEPPGPGGPNSSAPHIQECVWPAEGISSLILQVLPAPGNVLESIDLGDGYRVIDVDGMSGQAAAAIQQGNPEYGTRKGLAIFAIAKDDYMVTLSPVRLDIQEGSNKFVGAVKSIATDGGEVITYCISVLCKRRFGLFTSPSSLTC